MRLHNQRAWFPAVAAVLALAFSAPATADTLQITVTNNQPAGGFAFAPVWFGLHDGSYQTFTAGGTASSTIQTTAELGKPSALLAAFAGHGDQTVAGSAPIGPGSGVTALLSVADPSMNRYLSFASMVVPSNDFFMGNADPKAFEVFDASGAFLGPKTIQVYGKNVWDAGTEVNNIAFGAAFIVGDNINDHVAQGGVIALVFGGPDQTDYLNSILGKATPYGYDISHIISPDDLLATFQIQSVPEPSSLVLLGAGAGGLLIASVRKASRRRA
ncbi:spondin domain-containing protein [Paludisphaera borealis]|uniref:PEP-CTERM protein-sorting domain-containing protein n=1 Tax=Paludisphaera borealis TaxID=1387353 RepID=A0A1U7CU96_9BACT|nr:spondin domain-containing protein [Paludisphaera borealis]APW62502.1 hypothetical protein BSF38_04048 [Paludisphaera borealis]